MDGTLKGRWLCSVAYFQGKECMNVSKPCVRGSPVLESSLEGQTALQREAKGTNQGLWHLPAPAKGCCR